MVEQRTGVAAKANSRSKGKVAVTFADRLPAPIAEALGMRLEARYICLDVEEWTRRLDALPQVAAALPQPSASEHEPIQEAVVSAPSLPEKQPSSLALNRTNAVSAYRRITPLIRNEAQPLPERYAPDEASPVHYACTRLAPVLKYAVEIAERQDTWQADKTAAQMLTSAKEMLVSLQKLTDPRDPAKNLHPSIHALFHHLENAKTTS